MITNAPKRENSKVMAIEVRFKVVFPSALIVVEYEPVSRCCHLFCLNSSVVLYPASCADCIRLALLILFEVNVVFTFSHWAMVQWRG